MGNIEGNRYLRRETEQTAGHLCGCDIGQSDFIVIVIRDIYSPWQLSLPRSREDRTPGLVKRSSRRVAGKVFSRKRERKDRPSSDRGRPSMFLRRRVAINSPLTRSAPFATPKRPILSPPLGSRFTVVCAIGSANDPVQDGLPASR